MRFTPTSIPLPDPVVVVHPVGSSNTAISPAPSAAAFRVLLLFACIALAFHPRVLGVEG
jgi:hypothetical protein